MQTRFTFLFSANSRLAGDSNKRFIRARSIVDAVRQGVGRAVKDLSGEDDGLEFGYLVGREKLAGGNVTPVQSPCAISKWRAIIADETETEVGGMLSLLLDVEPRHSESLISQMIVMAGGVSGVSLKPTGVFTEALDYEITDEPITYRIDAFLPGEVDHRDVTNDRDEAIRRTRAKYPLDCDPSSRQTLSSSCGKAMKRHLLDIARHHGLSEEPIKDTIFIVDSYWAARPFDIKQAGQRVEAVSVVFKAPIRLSGDWHVGSYRHKGMGFIEYAPELATAVSKGVFVL